MTPRISVFGATEKEKSALLRAVLDGETPNMPRHRTIDITITGATSKEYERVTAAIVAALQKDERK